MNRQQFLITESVGINIINGRQGVNNTDDVKTVQRRLQELGFFNVNIDQSGSPTKDMIHAILLFQSIINGHARFQGKNRKYFPERRSAVDGIISPGKRTERWLLASNAPRWIDIRHFSPAPGFRFHPESEASGTDHYSTSWLKDVLEAAGKSYFDLVSKERSSFLPISAHEFSYRRGGYNPKHTGHQTGLVCDIRLPRNDGGGDDGVGGGITYKNVEYDMQLTWFVLLSLVHHPLVRLIIFNHDDLIAEINKVRGRKICIRDKKGNVHDNHIHVKIRPPRIR